MIGLTHALLGLEGASLEEVLSGARPTQPTEAESAEPTDPQALTQALIRWLHQKNQFIEVSPEATRALNRLFAQGLDELQRTPGRLAAHRDRLRRAISRLTAATGQREVVASEYRAELQLKLLGLTPAELRGPALDLGCGPKGHLVAHLQALGLEATGLDRHPEAPGLLQGDFLTWPLKPNTYALIVSHQAFSLFFAHHHCASATEAARYATRLMGLIAALTPGGVLAYVPGLPFIEPLLTDVRVHRTPLPEPLKRGLAPLSQAVGQDVGYATKLERLTDAR